MDRLGRGGASVSTDEQQPAPRPVGVRSAIGFCDETFRCTAGQSVSEGNTLVAVE